MRTVATKTNVVRWVWLAVTTLVAIAFPFDPKAVFAQVEANGRARPESKVNGLLDTMERDFAASRYGEAWARDLREMVELGNAAVSELIKELDATNDEIMLRNLGFVLRAIGDKRAIPALIRAFPKTLKKPSSDMGLRCEDADLMAFMQKHDLSDMDRDGLFSFGRPVREIGTALEKLSGVKHGEMELYGVFQQGGALQQHQQRRLFRQCAERWAAWWQEHWNEHVQDANYALVHLPADELPPAMLFPSGPGVKVVNAGSGYIAEPDDAATARRTVFFDLDTARMVGIPEALAELKDDPHRMDKIYDWAAREGFDLMGTFYQVAGSERPFYAIRGLGLSAWEIDSARYQTLANEIKEGVPLTLGRPAAGLLLHVDPKEGTYEPEAAAVFLFLTRESTFGVLFVGVEVLDTNVKLGERVIGDQALNPVGVYKGRRFSVKIIETPE